MTMASLAWSLKAWCALLLPISPRWAVQHNEQRRRLLTMDFATFLQVFIEIPCQVVKGARQVRWRIQAWNEWLGARCPPSKHANLPARAPGGSRPPPQAAQRLF